MKTTSYAFNSRLKNKNFSLLNFSFPFAINLSDMPRTFTFKLFTQITLIMLKQSETRCNANQRYNVQNYNCSNVFRAWSHIFGRQEIQLNIFQLRRFRHQVNFSKKHEVAPANNQSFNQFALHFCD